MSAAVRPVVDNTAVDEIILQMKTEPSFINQTPDITTSPVGNLATRPQVGVTVNLLNCYSVKAALDDSYVKRKL